jgi:hypothetical protein
MLRLIEEKPIHEGKWIFTKVDRETDLKNIIKLVYQNFEINNIHRSFYNVYQSFYGTTS